MYTARVSILQWFYRQKSCPDPSVYSKGVQNGRSEGLACRPVGKRRHGNFSGRCTSGPKMASELLKTTVLRPFPAALQGSASRVIFPGGAVAVRKLHQNYNGFVRLKASKCERYVLSAIQTPTEALRAQKDPQNAHSETLWYRFRAAPWIPRISPRAPLKPSEPRTLMLNHSAAFSRKLPRLQASRLFFF